MSKLKVIRERLGVTQAELAQGIGCTQGRVWQLEQGGTVQPDMAARLIAFAKERGQTVTYDEIYSAPQQAKAA